MIDIQPPKRGLHPLRHEFLRLGVDHAILLRQEVPGRHGLPERLRGLLLQAGSVDRPLHGGEQSALLRGGVLREGRSEGAFRHPDEAVAVGCELRRLRMRLPSAEHFADGLALVRRQRRDEDQALYALVLRRRDDGAGIRVRGQHDRALDPRQATIQGSNVVRNAR
jgi:hypothetical protein